MNKTLQEQFHDDMLAIYHVVGRATNGSYWPHRFRMKVCNWGGVEAARDYLNPKKYKDTSEGFERLKKLSQLQHSMEVLVLRECYSTLFTPEQLAAARQRLNGAGYAP